MQAPTPHDPLIIFGKGKTGEIARSIDWSKHPLGPVENWDTNLKTTLSLAMSSLFPMFIAWGEERYFFYNDAYAPILGNKHPSAFGQKFQTIWSEIWEDLLPLVNSVKNGEAVYLEDLKLIMNRKGRDEEAYFTFSYSPVRNKAGAIDGLFCSAIETTGRVKAESELEDILENMSDAFFTIDANWIVSRVNLQFEKIINMKRSDVIAKSLKDLYFSTPEQLESVYVKTYSKVMKDRKPASFIDYYAPFDIWTAVSVYPKPDGGLAVFFREISEERRAAQELKDAVAARDEFISIASHELKTPLTSLKIITQMQARLSSLEKAEAYSKDRIDRYVEKSDKLVSRLDRLIEDMLDISRIRTGKLTMQKHNVDLVGITKDVIERFQELFIVSSGERIKFHGPDEVIAEVDVMRIEQVIQNLLQNAIKYGDGELVEVFIKDLTDKVTLTVKDHGMGIDPAKQSIIFERFERGINANHISGLGLGLYISREIITSLGGKISVASEPGKGSAFTFEIPKQTPH